MKDIKIKGPKYEPESCLAVRCVFIFARKHPDKKGRDNGVVYSYKNVDIYVYRTDTLIVADMR